MKYTVYLLVLCLCLGACHKQEEKSVSNEAAARIGSVVITQQDVARSLDLLDQKDRKFADTPIGRQNLLQVLTREKLILEDARTTGMEQEEDYQQALAQKRAELDRTYEQFAQDALVRIWYEKNGEKLGPSDKEIKAYYDQYPYEMTIRQIIVDNAQTADQVLRTLKSSPSRWNTMAKQYSVAPEQLQTVTVMPGEYLSALEVIAANSAVGSVQGFFKTPQGFHIIMKTGEKRLTLEQAAPRIKQVLQQQRLDELLDTLKTTYEVIIYDKNE
ncbi:MAG: peptidylprolyl isomerase [Elusimicrobiaceae bacterium]|nr:peptidylprolyl isomerase [Elusimicrobiaceae bacterium]